MTDGTYALAEGAPRTLSTWLREKAKQYGDRTALIINGVGRSYADIADDSDRLAGGFAALASPGSHACVLMANSAEMVDVWFALARADIVEIPINTANRGSSLSYIVDQSDATLIVVDQDLVGALDAVLAETPKITTVVVVGDTLPRLSRPVEVQLLRDLYRQPPPLEPHEHWWRPTVILYTSGTTGPSKGAVLCHETLLNLARQVVWMLDYTEADTLYTPFPLFHIDARARSVLPALEVGARVILEKRFSASRFWQTCQEYGVTAFNYQGALLSMIWKQPERPDDAENTVRVASGAGCAVGIWEAFERRFGLTLVEMYGMTEASIILQNLPRDRRIGSCGKPSGNFDVRLIDDHGVPVAPGEIGEFVARPLRPHIVVQEYYKQPEKTIEAFRDCWFHTGDRGRMDTDGYYYFVDRRKDMIRRRGENVSSWEVEQVVARHPSILDVAAYPVPSPEFGGIEEEVMIAVTARPGYDVPLADLIAHCHEHLPAFAVPRFVRVVMEFPRTPSQRVEKYKLRAEGITGDSWDARPAGAR